jgi:hypothetical protein
MALFFLSRLNKHKKLVSHVLFIPNLLLYVIIANEIKEVVQLAVLSYYTDHM